MIFEDFVSEVKKICDHYLKYVFALESKGMLDSAGGSILYPNILLVTNSSGFYIAELIGATRKYDGLTLKRHKEESIYRYFSQFDDSEPDACARLEGAGSSFMGVCLAQEADFEIVSKRFPAIDLYQSKLNRIGGRGSVFSFGETFESCSIENCVLINHSGHLYRCKNILSAYIFKSGVTKRMVIDFFNKIFSGGEIKGIHTTQGGNEERIVVASQLQNMYLFPRLRETTIGEFLNLHPEIVKKAFKTDHFEYEPYLEWIEHDGTCNDKAINPDLMVRREDGFFDIYDLKTAALTKKIITKGPRARRRFIDYVEEGVAQLVNYREYFKYPKNADYAKEKYGVEVDDPKLVLVVGSWENSSLEKIDQACRRYPNVEVIDYDTFCHLFIGVQ